MWCAMPKQRMSGSNSVNTRVGCSWGFEMTVWALTLARLRTVPLEAVRWVCWGCTNAASYAEAVWRFPRQILGQVFLRRFRGLIATVRRLESRNGGRRHESAEAEKATAFESDRSRRSSKSDDLPSLSRAE